MEAIAGITDIRETLGWCRSYWQHGRAAYTDDVVAAAQGLLEAGADEVVVLDNHGAGAPWNIMRERFPDRVRGESVNVFDLPALGIDGLLLLGYHPPAQIDGFVPHTYVPGLRLFVDDVEIGEAHGRAWAADVPLLGITGHAALRPTLGDLADAPFLTVQTGTDRLRATPVFADPGESARAIRAFAADCLRAIDDAPHPAPPESCRFVAQVRGAEHAALELGAWTDAREPIAAAMGAAMEPFMPLLAHLDMSSEEAFEAQDPAIQDELTAAITAAV